MSGQGLITYGYDERDAVTSITQNSLTASMVYDALGRLSRRTLPNGVVTDWTFTTCGAIASVISSRNSVAFDSHSYQHDAAHNITQHTVNGGANSLVYDDLNRLASCTVGGVSCSWVYDLVGNRTSQTAGGVTTPYSYDNANRLTGVNGAAVTSDANGSVIGYGNDVYGWNTHKELIRRREDMSEWHPHANYRHVFVVLRVDTFPRLDVPLETRITATKALWTREAAESEVRRLNDLNADKGCNYLWTVARLVDAPAEPPEGVAERNE